jgi:hypothetical protein
MRELWQPHEYVRIMNIDTETFYWQSLAPQDETFEIDRGPTKVTYRRDPRQFHIDAGKSRPLEGWNAYICVENLYKKVLAKQKLAKKQGKFEVTFDWQDPHGWDEFLPRIFLGKENPTFSEGDTLTEGQTTEQYDAPAIKTATEVSSDAKTVDDLAKELGIELTH